MIVGLLLVVIVIIFMICPAAFHWLALRWSPLRSIGLVVPCYLLGIALGNQPWLTLSLADINAIDAIAGACVVTAIVLMLIPMELAKVQKLARNTLRALGLALVAVCIVSTLAAWTFHDALNEGWQVSGMLVAVYTGGIPNLVAVSGAVGADPERLLAISTTDVAIGGAYLLFLLLCGSRVFGWLLPTVKPQSMPTTEVDGARRDEETKTVRPIVYRATNIARALILGASIVASAVCLAMLAPVSARDPVTIVLVTAIASALSLSVRLRRLPALYATGNYLLQVFCVALGMMADISVLANMDVILFIYTASVVFGSIALHTLLCVLAGIDRDTCIITQVASIYGPPFIAPVATRLGNRAQILPGVTAGIVGLALGNYLGLLIAWCTRSLFG